MLKILYYGESSLNPTGFGQVNYHICNALSSVANVTMVASSHFYPNHDMPYKILACDDTNDPRNLKKILEQLEVEENWDCFIYQGDIGANDEVLLECKKILEQDESKSAVFYMPIDCNVATHGAFIPWSWCSVPATYSTHGKNVCMKYLPDVAANMSVIPLGCEIDNFYPLSPEEKRQARSTIFGAEYLDRFIVMNINRNQVRKDLARSMSCFHIFHEKYPDSTLYLHSVLNDSGGHLPTQAFLVNCDVFKKPAEIAFSTLDLNKPWSREMLNKLYNAVDCVVSTSYGEGWGLTTTEAMCAGTPVLVPNNTANIDIIGTNQDRGWFIESGGDIDHTTYVYGNGGTPASIIHSESFVKQLEYIYKHKDEAEKKSKIGRKWCEENSWQHVQQMWKDLVIKLEEHKNAREIREEIEE